MTIDQWNDWYARWVGHDFPIWVGEPERLVAAGCPGRLPVARGGSRLGDGPQLVSAELLEFFEPRRAAVRVSELVWVSCPRCGGEVECAGIADAILHARWCGTPVL